MTEDGESSDEELGLDEPAPVVTSTRSAQAKKVEEEDTEGESDG